MMWTILTWIVMLIVIVIILGLVSRASYLIYKLQSDEQEKLAKTVSIVGGIIGAFSLVWAAHTYYDSVNRQKELSAYGIYQEHMKLSIEKPLFLGASEFAKMEPPNENSSVEEKQKYEPYQWYVGHALFGFESILEVFPNDYGWRKTFSGFIVGHQKYICNKEFDRERYSLNLQQLIQETCP